MSIGQNQDLILEDISGVNVSGFGPVDFGPKGRWRWAVGESQSIRFPTEPGMQYLSYRIHLFYPDVSVELQVGGGAPIRLEPSRAEEMVTGSLEFFSAEGEACVEFKASKHAATIGAHELAFSVHGLRLHRIDNPVLDKDPAQILRNGVPAFFCAYPFVALFLGQAGAAYPCCHTQNPAPGFPGNAERVRSKEDVARAWNSPLLLNVRKQMLSGKRPSVCDHCIRHEDAGAESLRQRLNQSLLHKALVSAESSDREGRMSASPLLLDIQQGNRCNLKCRMCGPNNSYRLIEEHSEIVGGKLDFFRKNFWLGNQEISRELVAGLGEIQEFQMIGGEPFLTKEYLEILRQLISTGRSREITLSLNSNLTVLMEPVAELFRQFKGVRLRVSLEGVGPVNDFIRYPSKFSVVERNLRTLYENPGAWNLKEVSFNTTVQVYNVFALPDLFEHLEKSFPRFHWFPELSILSDPPGFSVQILPELSRRRAATALGRYLESMVAGRAFENPEVTPELIRDRVLSVIHVLEGEERKDLRPEFFRLHEIFDRHRKHTIPYAIPGLIGEGSVPLALE